MDKNKRIVWIASSLLVGLGITSLVLNFGFGVPVNFAWPLAVIMLGVGFYILVSLYSKKWGWTELLYIPGSILIALGIVFLVNVLTNDWNAWAYAWLLVLAGAGMGIIQTGRARAWRPEIGLAGTGLIAGGMTLFVLFGALAGGRFILLTAPILLVLGGLSLRWLRLETLLPEGFLSSPQPAGASPAGPVLQTPDQAGLVEPLSNRELEVLGLIDQGLSNPEIAEKLTLAPSTVKSHINNIYGKLGAQTRIQAIKQARKLSLLK